MKTINLMKQWNNGDTLTRSSRYLLLTFSGTRKVLSTSVMNGGYRQDLTCIFNYDEKDPDTGLCIMEEDTYEKHLRSIAQNQLHLDPDRCAGLTTAAQMKNAVIREASHLYPDGRELLVSAIVTGGIDKNGARAGDQASFTESHGNYELASSIDSGDLNPHRKKVPEPGTINTILYIHAAMSEAAMVNTIVVATEAKAALLQDLKCPSLYGDGIATGSGTDGIIIICHPDSEHAPLYLTAVNHMTKAGELVSTTIKDALREALWLQTGVR